jgi:hypothetical protein
MVTDLFRYLNFYVRIPYSFKNESTISGRAVPSWLRQAILPLQLEEKGSIEGAEDQFITNDRNENQTYV